MDVLVAQLAVAADGRAVDAAAFFRETMELIARRYQALSEALGDTGESTNEDARYVLPNACETKTFVTMNARALLHFFEERLCLRAQWEIRGVADAKATEIYAAAYNRSPEAVEFYEFTRTMQSYRTTIAENTTLVLSTDSDLFKFLKGMASPSRIGAPIGDVGGRP